MTITIKPITTEQEIKQVEEIQRLAWGYGDRVMVPWEFLKVLVFNGAALIGAFDERRLVGHVFGVFGTAPNLAAPADQTEYQMYSHQLAVHPDYQGRGIGRRLKLAQRDRVRPQGIKQITWTFDPLVARNAWLNIGRLGAIANVFLPDFYGTGNHRLYAEWWIETGRVQKRSAKKRRPVPVKNWLVGDVRLINEPTFDEQQRPHPADYTLPDEALMAVVEIPYDYEGLAAEAADLAGRWRDHARQLFLAVTQVGYVMTDFTTAVDEQGRSRAYYLLTHNRAGRAFGSIA